MFAALTSHATGKPVKIGKPLQLTATKHLLFRIDTTVPAYKVLGGPVVDTSMTNRVGTVFDLFGPVDAPFLSVKLDPRVPVDEGALSRSVYFVLQDRPRSRKKGKVVPRKPTTRT